MRNPRAIFSLTATASSTCILHCTCAEGEDSTCSEGSREFTDLIHHVGVSEGAVALSVTREVEAQAAQACFSKCRCQLRQHETILMVTQAMAQDGNVLHRQTCLVR